MRSLANHRPQVIDATNPRHIAWWAAEFGVSEDSLMDMVDIVGNQARVVEYYLHLREVLERHKTAALANASVTPSLTET